MDSLIPHDNFAGTFLEKHLSVKAAAETFGYNQQYLRRLLRASWLQGVKTGQAWLINLASLEAHLRRGCTTRDWRLGPQGISTQGERDVLDRFDHLGARMAEQNAAVDVEEVAADVAAAVQILIPS